MKKVLIIILSSLTVIIAGLLLVYFLTIKTIVGTFSCDTFVVDEKYGVTSESGILIKNVEMVQYYKDEDGKVDLVFANYPIESFDNYKNPEFPNEITSDLFYRDVKFGKYELSKEVIESIAYNDKIEKIQLTNLPEEAAYIDNLILNNNAYVTASNDWQLGEIRVTYYYVDMSKEYKITAVIKNNVIININSIEKAN